MGYNVIFLHRSNSHKPFLHRLKTEEILQNLQTNNNDSISCNAEFATFYSKIFNQYHQSKDKILLVEYFSVTEYLHLLLSICKLLNPLGCKAILFLAAAVSDFYLPIDMMEEHKIQSGYGDLELCLKPVPKLIKFIKTKICPDAFIVSFKLETDHELVIKKAKESLKKYQHDLAISNCLATRERKLILLDKKGEEVIETQGGHIEKVLIDRVIDKYKDFIKNKYKT
jgi:phosphopantothenate---cysteine ligase (ATP)